MEVLLDTYKDTKVGRIPKDWKVVKANELCLKVTDGTHDSPKRVDKGYNLVTSKNLKNGELDFSTCYQISENDYLDVNKRSCVEQYDVLFGMIGTIGSPVMITQSHVNFAVKNVGIFKSNGDKNLGQWLCHFFNSDIAKNYIERNKNSSTQSFVALGFLRAFPIINPPLKERNKIADILSTVDEQISITDKIIEKSKELKKGLMQKLFSEGIGHKEFKDTKIGRIPKDWELKKIGEIVETSSGGTPLRTNSEYYVNGTIPWVKTGELNNKYLFESKEHITASALKNSSAKLFPKYSILVAMYGATIGKMSIIINEMASNQACCALFPSNNVYYEYLYYSLIKRKKALISRGVGGAQPNISQKLIKVFELPIPPLKEQQKIAAILSEADAKIEKEQTQKVKLEALKKGLMQQLLTGKKRVNV